nr:hypothetical protein [Prevotella sp.]
KIAESNIDTYQYNPDDDVEGDIDTERTYTEQDFYCGNIEMRQRDEHRVKELLDQIDPDEKTLIFCATQAHAMNIRDMVNQYKKRPASNYCERVTSNDGKTGEETLRQFQNNDLMLPTILTTSQKLSTGVDARNVRNIVLFRPVNNMVEFKQILGRGTRLFDGKYYFTLYDFVGASRNFQDQEWDGDPFCPVCGNYPCSCKPYPAAPDDEGKVGDPKDVDWFPAEPCPICGHLPCTCDGGGKIRKTAIKVKLSKTHELMLHTEWTERIQFGDELITIDEYVKKLFGMLPSFFSDEDDLREKWSQPETRAALLDLLAESGFQEDKLEKMRHFMQMEDCDMLDVLEFLAYHTKPIDRERRAAILKENLLKSLSAQQQDFVTFMLDMYVRNGFKELASDKLGTLVEMKYHSFLDAVKTLNMKPQEVKSLYLNMQHELYNGEAVANFKLKNEME